MWASRALVILSALSVVFALRLARRDDVTAGEEHDVKMPSVFVTMHTPQHRKNGYSSGTSSWPKINSCWIGNFLKHDSFKTLEVYALDDEAVQNAKDAAAEHNGEDRVKITRIPDSDSGNARETLDSRHTPQKSLERIHERTEVEEEESFEQPTKRYMVQFFNIIMDHLMTGKDVLHSDSDSMWVNDPWPILKETLKQNPDSDLIAAPGFAVNYKHFGHNPLLLDTGFMYLKSSPRTINMISKLREEMINTRNADMNGEMKKINRHVFDKEGCEYFNANGELYVPVNSSAVDDNPNATQSEVKAIMAKAEGDYKAFVDSRGLTGTCNHDMKVTFLDHHFVRPGNKETSVLVHPRLSWIRYVKDVYKRFQKEAPGVCPKP